MRIFGNCVVKNEADIVEETLRHALGWCDRVFVFDNGSTDTTWDQVCRLAAIEPRVVPFKSAAVPFSDALRSEAFNHFRHECAQGDWWCRLDADEMYVDDPRAFLSAVPARHHVVWGVNFQFHFTDLDLGRYEDDPKAFPPHVPAERALRFYRCEYSEVRFFRYRPGLEWLAGSSPRHVGVVHPRRIRFKHYQYRSPLQIAQRLKIRQEAIASGCESFKGHCSETDWRQKVVPAAGCRNIDADANPFEIEEHRIPRHVEPAWQRVAKLALHGAGIWP